ncbi:hypothetical protein D3C81_2201840 [compost metagenome]
MVRHGSQPGAEQHKQAENHLVHAGSRIVMLRLQDGLHQSRLGGIEEFADGAAQE